MNILHRGDIMKEKNKGGFLYRLKESEMFWAPLITFLILLGVFAFKGIYPFGSGTVDQYGMTDMHLPMYAHTWDVLHGRTPLYYDWLTGAGSDFFMAPAFYIFSPLNLFFLFVGRDKLLESMSFFLMIKLILASASQAFYLKKEYGKNLFQNTAVALFYAFCGYTLQQYGNIFYLDTVILFPLLMYALKRMIKTRKGFVYLLFAALTVISNPYLGAMVLIFVVFYVFGYIIFIAEKDESRRITAQLGQYTLIALLLSMFVLCPAVFKWVRSARLEMFSDMTYSVIIKSLPGSFQGSKIFMLCGAEIGFSALIAALARVKLINKRETRMLSFNVYLIFIVLMPVAIESVQYLWNLGTDTGVPMRYAFILTFVLLDFYKYANAESLFVISTKKEQRKLVRFTTFLMGGVCIFMLVMLANHADITIFNDTGKTLYIPAFAAAIIFGCLLAGEENAKYGSIMLLVFAAVHSAVISADFISPKDYNTSITEEYKEIAALQNKTKLGLSDDVLSRVKIIEPSASYNYPLIANTASLSAGTNETSREYVKQMHAMGYTQYGEKVSDVGGTAFSDALLGVKYVLSKSELDPALYEKQLTANGFNVYKCKYTLPFGMVVPHRFVNTSFSKYGMDNQNLIYGALWSFIDPLISVYDNDELIKTKSGKEDEEFVYNMELAVKGEKTLYISAYWNEYNTYSVRVNGRDVLFTIEDAEVAYTYPSVYNSGIVSLGTFRDETVELVICTKDKDLTGLRIGAMDTLKLKALIRRYKESCADTVQVKKNKIHITTSVGNSGEVMLIPVEYSENWKAEINGEPADIFPVMNSAFMGVALTDAPSDITLTYVPVQFYAGLILSMIGLLFVFWSYVRIKENLDWADAKILRFVTFPLFILMAIALCVLMYVVPVIAYLLRLLEVI